MADKPEWKLNGQMLTLTYPLEETITTIKVFIYLFILGGGPAFVFGSNVPNS